jgi:DNA-binding NarL/FixJ family response regulator
MTMPNRTDYLREPRHPQHDALGLSPRQTQVLRGVLAGRSNKQICRELNLSVGTVKVHISAVLKALQVHSRAQAMVKIAELGGLPPLSGVLDELQRTS